MTDLDTTFNTPNGYITTDFDAIPTINSLSTGKAIALQSDGKIVMTGNYYNIALFQTTVAVCRYNTNGTLDTTFGGSGTGKITVPIQSNNANVYGIALQSDGKIVICGNLATTFFDIFVMRLTSAGIVDTTFGSLGLGYVVTVASDFGTFDSCEAYSVSIQTDGKLVVGGSIRQSITLNNHLALLRYDTSGSLDTSFGFNGFVDYSSSPLSKNEYGNSVAIQSDGKILLGGKSVDANLSTDSYFCVARFNGFDGSQDNTFGTNAISILPSHFFPSSTDKSSSIKIQSNGYIVIAGTSIKQTGNACYALARLDTSGILDTSFGTGGLVTTDLSSSFKNLYGNTMGIQSDGKIVLGGVWNTLGTYPSSFALARYNTTGLLDNTFGVAGTGLILEDLLPNSSYVETGYSLSIQPDGKILMGGVVKENLSQSGPQRFILARYFGFPPLPPPIVPICFPAGTPVTTDQGEIFIELIDPDIHTILNKKIVAITETVMLDNNIVCFEKNSLGYNIPNKKTHISKYHSIMYNHKLIEAYKFVGRLRGVYYEKYNGELLYNILMEKHYIIKINNLKVETLNPKNFVAHLYTNDYTLEEKKNIILKMNEQTKRNANIINNTISLRNIQYTRKSYHQNRLYNNYFVTKLHNRTIRNSPLFQKEKHNSNTLKYRPFINIKNHYIGKTHKRFNR